jgi:hypothetical protein
MRKGFEPTSFNNAVKNREAFFFLSVYWWRRKRKRRTKDQVRRCQSRRAVAKKVSRCEGGQWQKQWRKRPLIRTIVRTPCASKTTLPDCTSPRLDALVGPAFSLIFSHPNLCSKRTIGTCRPGVHTPWGRLELDASEQVLFCPTNGCSTHSVWRLNKICHGRTVLRKL